MKSTFHIDTPKNLITVQMLGPITVADEIVFIDTVVADPKFKIGMNTIADMTEAEYDWTMQDIDQFRSWVRSNEKRLGPCKWALLSNGGVTLSNAKLFVVLHEIHPNNIQIKLFTNRFDAIKWLKGAD